MNKLMKKMVSFLMIFAICFTFMGGNIKAFADSSYEGGKHNSNI